MKLILPLEGIGSKPGIRLSQKFGEMQLDYAQFGLKGHNGIDISTPIGTPVLASHDGKVDFFKDESTGGELKGYGLNARITFTDGSDWELIYGHLEKYEGVARAVKAGDIIGYADNTGYSFGSHLHFGVREWKDGKIINYENGFFGWIDPAPFFRRDNMKIYVDRRTSPPTVVCGIEVDTPENLIWYGKQSNLAVPLKDGKVDWDNINYDGEIK